MQQDPAYRKAKERVQEIKGFYNHLIIFTVIHVMILATILYFNGDLKFFITFTALGWGIGLLVHAVIVFKWNPFTVKQWEHLILKNIIKVQENKN